jgi:hypothetical protein
MKANLKKADIKCALAILPLFASTILTAAADPVMLARADMDRITAGTQKIAEQAAGFLAGTASVALNIQQEEVAALTADQLALLHKIASGELAAFQRLPSGELAAAQQLQSGQQIVLVRQGAPADAAPASALSAGGNVTTYLLKPGEALNIRQTSGGGTNYLYIRSSGASSITATQQIIR